MELEKINVMPTKLQRISSILGIALLIIGFIVLAMKYQTLPDTMPKHFGFDGKADAWGSKTIVWFPMIGALLLNVLLYVVGKFPQMWNIPVNVTDRNRTMLYQLTGNMIAVLRLEMTTMFMCFLMFEIYYYNLPSSMILFFMALIGGTLMIYIIKMQKHKEKETL
ncbi:MAG: DUF1648 domain-containing protein [Longicatena sp.]